jgi:hypothetical protein
VRKIKNIELIAIVSCLIFAVAISLYHLSYGGYLGLSLNAWYLIWALAENGFSLSLCAIIGSLTTGLLQFIFRWLFVPYFAIKLLYHISVYGQVYIISGSAWNWLWSFELVILILVGLFCCVIYLKTEK